MLVKNILALLLAGLAVVTATNSSSSSDTAGSSSSSDTAASSSSSNAAASSSSGSTAGSSSSANQAASSSSTANTGSSSSGTTAASSSANPAASSSSTANTGSSSSKSMINTGSSSKSMINTGSSSKSMGNTGSSSADTGVKKGNGTEKDNTAKVAAPKKTKVLETSIEATFKFPAGSTCGVVSSDMGFTNAYEAAACKAAGVTTASCQMTKIECSKSRLRQLGSHNATGATVALKLKGTISIAVAVGVTKDTIAAKLKTATETSTSFLTDVTATATVGGKAVAADMAQKITVTAAVEKSTTESYGGAFTLMHYANKECSGAAGSTAVGTVGKKCNEKLKVGTNDMSFYVLSCDPDRRTMVQGFQAATCTGTPTNLKFAQGQCIQMGAGSMKFMCGAVTASTSDASTKSLVGVVFGLIMGFVTLM